MADVTKIGIEVESSSANNQNIKSLKAQLREAVLEAQKLSQQDMGSAEAVQAQKRVAELRDQIEDTNEAISAFTGAGQFKAIGNVVQGLAGGFAAAQGAAALFGSESEDLQKVLVKLNAAMALSQGVAQLEGLMDSFKALRTMIITNVIPSLTTLRGALIATGVGAAAVAVGLLLANWDKVVSVVRKFIGLGPTQQEILEKQTKELEKQNKLIEDRGKTQDLYIRALSGRNREIAELTKQHTDEILQLQQDYQEAQLKIQKDEKLSVDEKYNALRDLDKKYKEDQKALLAAHDNELKEQREGFAKEDADKQKQRDEKEKERLKKLQDEAKDDYEFYSKLSKDLAKKQAEDELGRKKSVLEARRELYQNNVDTLKQTVNDENTANEERLASLRKLVDMGQATENDYFTFKESLRIRDIENQQFYAESIGSILGNLSSAVGANAEVQKKIAMATTLIDTYFAAQKAYTSQLVLATPDAPVRATLAAAAAVAAGLARVAAIARVNPRSGAGGGGVSGGGGATPAPPTFAPAQGTQVQGAGDLRIGTQPQQMKVFVVESDIRNTMNRVDVIDRNRTIG